MKKKYFTLLVLLLVAVTGAWAEDTYTVTFKANGNTKTVENDTLPKTFKCSFDYANGELDLILKELYGWIGNVTTLTPLAPHRSVGGKQQYFKQESQMMRFPVDEDITDGGSDTPTPAPENPGTGGDNNGGGGDDDDSGVIS